MAKIKGALALERKIENAIERGEFTPATGYLDVDAYLKVGDKWRWVALGPCGCALAAAAVVSGLVEGVALGSDLKHYLIRTTQMSHDDCWELESGYEGHCGGPSIYFQVGQRLRRFHPNIITAE